MKSQTSKWRVLTIVASTLFATSLHNGVSAGLPQIFFPADNTKYENPPPPPKQLSKNKMPGYQNVTPAVKQAVNSNGPLYYTFPSQSYNVWHRPGEAAWTARERCQPRKFCPRGFGDLGSKPRCGYRLDYHRHVLRDTNTVHGPAFYQWSMEPRRCCEIEKGKCGCDRCQSKKRLKLFR
ncbi:MAG: hypothetical protein IID46_13145 [Planctomycetes bacterium]|nr:hypothetical protein [Planctomycetota bacterium]